MANKRKEKFLEISEQIIQEINGWIIILIIRLKAISLMHDTRFINFYKISRHLSELIFHRTKNRFQVLID